VIALAAVVLVPLKLEFVDADATARRGGAIQPAPPVAVATEEEPPAAAPAPPPEPPAAAAPVREPPKKKAAAPRAARKAAPPPAAVAPPPEPVVQAALDPAPAVPRPPETGTLLLAVLPWGDIYIDGKRQGTTPPLATIDLPPGRHRVEIRNPSQPSYFALIQVRAGERQRLEYRFAD